MKMVLELDFNAITSNSDVMKKATHFLKQCSNCFDFAVTSNIIKDFFFQFFWPFPNI